MSYDTLQSQDRWVGVVLIAQSDGMTPVTDAIYSDLDVAYGKEGDSSATVKTMAASDWYNLGDGLYRIKFSTSELNTLGRFEFSVVLDGTYACAEFMPYYGYIEVVSNTTNTIGTQQDTIEGKIDTIDTNVDNIETQQDTMDTKLDIINASISDIENIHNNFVGMGAYFNSSSGVLSISVALHRDGEIVDSPVSGTYQLFNASGTSLASGISTSPDSQGIFTFSHSVSLTEGTIPYVKGSVTDASGTFYSIVVMPVIG